MIRSNEPLDNQFAESIHDRAQWVKAGTSKVVYQAYTNQAQSVPHTSLLPTSQKRASTSRIFLG